MCQAEFTSTNYHRRNIIDHLLYDQMCILLRQKDKDSRNRFTLGLAVLDKLFVHLSCLGRHVVFITIRN